MKTISMLGIENTTICGADCIMCPRHTFLHEHENMSYDFFCHCVDEAVNCGVEAINILGFGDPLIDPGFAEKAAYVKERYPNITVGTTSTCHVLKGETLDAVCKYIDIFQISMYGMTKNTYESVHRGSLKFEEIWENINELLNRKDRPRTMLEYIVLPENKHELQEWRSYFEGRCDRVNVWNCHNWGGDYHTQYKDKPHVKCFRIETLNGLYVRTDGSVTLCCMDYNRKRSIGNIKENSLQEILTGKLAREFQQMNEDGRIYECEMCRDCDQLHDRSQAIIYSSDPEMVAGKHSMLPGKKIYKVEN